MTRRPDEALRVADAALAADPNSAAIYSARGFIEMQLGQFDRAKADALEAIRLSPRDPQIGLRYVGEAMPNSRSEITMRRWQNYILVFRGRRHPQDCPTAHGQIDGVGIADARLSAVGGRTTGLRILISPLDEGSARCNASRARAQHKDFSPLTPPSSTPSTSNATSPPLLNAPHLPRRAMNARREAVKAA
jgi:tetratricopeptide (TPR) repeat protein